MVAVEFKFLAAINSAERLVLLLIG